MKSLKPKTSAVAALLLALSATSQAAPATYNIDPSHTFPSIEVDHLGGLSVWRGKFNQTSGSIQLDTAARVGSVDITINISSIDFGHDKFNAHAVSPDILDAAKFPTATYKGKLAAFEKGQPTLVEGELTLHGVTKPVQLKINQFKCIMHPMLKREVCGADASGQFNRADFGVNYGQQMGFKQDVLLRIQVEGVKAD
jgi:polyisoprenoid-binding protein YceI